MIPRTRTIIVIMSASFLLTACASEREAKSELESQSVVSGSDDTVPRKPVGGDFADCGSKSPSYVYLNEIMPTLPEEGQLILDPRDLRPQKLYDLQNSIQTQNEIQASLFRKSIDAPSFKQNSIDVERVRSEFSAETLRCWAEIGDQIALVSAPREVRPPPIDADGYPPMAEYLDAWIINAMKERASQYDDRCMAMSGDHKKCFTAPFKMGAPEAFYVAYLAYIVKCEQDSKLKRGFDNCKLARQAQKKGFSLGHGVLFASFYNYEPHAFAFEKLPDN